ncbi:hypothetical protein LT493_09735 [Streptomyces tricolor]|nr:hypothetical protein [Streptomyces tricolor]
MLAAGEDLLTGFGLGAHFVPEDLGGRLARLDDLIRVMRAVYRRDPCLGLGHGAGSLWPPSTCGPPAARGAGSGSPDGC